MEKLGGPDGWEWRGPQQALVDRIANSKKDIVLLQAEPGIGKTSIAWGLSQVAEGDTCILVHTRQLQRQYLRDFHLAMIEGRRHYKCKVTGAEAFGAPCSLGARCDHKGKKNQFGWVRTPDCDYYLTKMKAEQAKVSVHNYAYWLTETEATADRSAFTGVDWIVCDEAHDIQSVLMDFSKIHFDQSELFRLNLDRVPLSDDYEGLTNWQEDTFWTARERHEELVRKLRASGIHVPHWGQDPREDSDDSVYEGIEINDEMKADLGSLRTYHDLMTRLVEAGSGPLRNEGQDLQKYWIIDRKTNRKKVTFAPLYANLGMRKIRAAANKVLLMSAYLAPKLLIPMLGLKPEDCDVIEAPPMYNRRSSPFAYLPVTKMSFKTPDYEWKRVTKVIDELIDTHAPDSGIIIVPSKRLRNTIFEASRHQDKLITYEGEKDLGFGDLTKDRALDKLRYDAKRGQAVLLGQSISTGVDLPYVIGFSIIVKLAYPPMEDPVLKVRMEKDPAFQPYSVLCTLVQSAGRSKRAEDHDCVTYILDGHFMRFFKRYNDDFPGWFKNYLLDGKRLRPQLVADLRTKGVVL